MWEIGSKWLGRLSLLVVFFALVGLGVAQIVSTTSNLYILTQALPKRTLILIIGAVFSLTTLVPNYRDYRLLSFIGICSTFYTACYIVAASAAHGQIENVEYTAPTSLYGFFTAFTNIIFMFGAHTVCVGCGMFTCSISFEDLTDFFDLSGCHRESSEDEQPRNV